MQAVILAGGRSSRFWPLNTRHKSLVQVAGRSLLERTLDGLAAAGVSDVVIVQGADRAVADAVDVPDGVSVSFAVQDEPHGMGHALRQAQDALDERFVVTSPYRIDIAVLLAQLRDAAQADGAVAGTVTDRPERYGMLALDGDRATGIVEKPDPGEAPSDVKAVSTYLLDPGFFDALDAVEQHEYSFEDALDRYMDGGRVGVARIDADLPSLKYPWDLFTFRDRILTGQEPQVAESADVADTAVLDGNVVVAADATVYEHAVLRGPCYVGPRCTVGNGAVVRSGTVIEADGTVGAHAEIRGSIIQDGFSCHSGFIGDSIIGRDVAVGAGTVTANRRVRDGDGGRPDISVRTPAQDAPVETGMDRLGAVVGAGTDIGTQVNLMPGALIGAGSFVGPSTMVRGVVDDDTTVYARTETVERER